MQVTVSFIVDVAASADINQIEQGVQEAGQQAMREAVGQAVRAVEEHKKVCPHCAGADLRSEGTDRRIVLTKFGRVRLALRRMQGPGCGRRFRPASDCLKSLAGGNITTQLREVCIQAGASWPYAPAAQVVRRLCGAQISAEQVRRLTNRIGSQEARRQAAEAKRIVEPTAAQVRAEREAELRRSRQKQQQRPELLLVGMGGGWVKSREQKKGMEGKVGVIASQVEAIGKQGRHRLTRRGSVATFESSTRARQADLCCHP